MPNKRLNNILLTCLLSISCSASNAAIFSGGDDDDSGPKPPPRTFSTPPSQSRPAPSQPRSSAPAPRPAPQVGMGMEPPKTVEELTQQATELANDPAKLQQLLQSIQNQQPQPSPSSGGSSGSGSSGSGKTSSEEELERVRQQIQDIRDRADAGESKALDDQAFKLLLEKTLPMNPDQIKLLRKLYDVTDRASSTPANPPPTPMSSSSVVSLEPGKTPPVIRLSAGFVTSIVFSDSTGAPWPIVSYTLGDPTAFNIQWDQKSNTLFIQSSKSYSHGNLAVTLYDNPTPVMLSMVSGQKEVDFRIDFQIAGRGPEATAPIMSESLSDAKTNPELINILDGIPPKGSTKLHVSGNHGQAWSKGDTLYFRSKLAVLSPAWVGTVSSPDGTHVYEMMLTPSILASKDGQTIDIRITGL